MREMPWVRLGVCRVGGCRLWACADCEGLELRAQEGAEERTGWERGQLGGRRESMEDLVMAAEGTGLG